MNAVPAITLNDGHTIPQLGLGVFMIRDLARCKQIVGEAFTLGYRHIDTAQLYKNEAAVGAAMAQSGLPREDIFLTTKIWPSSFGFEKTTEAIDRSLRTMRLEYIDLLLLHQELDDYLGAWRALEAAVGAGKVRSIGISNFSKAATQAILDHGTIPPAVNQIQLHPYYQQASAREFAAAQSIAVESWYPLGHGDQAMLRDPVLVAIAAAHGKTVAQVILRWHIQIGAIVFPKASSTVHLTQNIDIFDFELSEDEMSRIGALDKGTPKLRVPKWLFQLVYKVADKF